MDRYKIKSFVKINDRRLAAIQKKKKGGGRSSLTQAEFRFYIGFVSKTRTRVNINAV